MQPELARQLMSVGVVLDEERRLPEPFIPAEEGVDWAWLHTTTGLYTVWTWHRPIYLTTGRCSLCASAHDDIVHMILYMSQPEFFDHWYARYTSARLPSESGAAVEGGLDSSGTMVASAAATEQAANGNG